MPTIRVTKRGGFQYGVGAARQQYGLGKEFVAKQKDARMLVAAKLAEYVEAPAPAAKPKAAKAVTQTTAAKRTTTATATKTTAAKRRTYNRRDMKAK